MTLNALTIKEEMYSEELSDVKPDYPIETLLANSKGTVPCLKNHDGGVISSSGCEEMTSNAFIVKEEMNSEELSDVKPDNLIETVLVNVNETVPCPKSMKSVNDVGTPFLFIGIKREMPDDYENEACGNLGTQYSSEVNCTNHDRKNKRVDECLEGSSTMVPSSTCNFIVKMEPEEDSENEFDFQTNDVMSMTRDTNYTFDFKSVEKGCDVGHSSEKFIKRMYCLEHTTVQVNQEREHTDKQIAINRKNSAFGKNLGTLNSEENKELNKTFNEEETLESKDCQFNPEMNCEKRYNPLQGKTLSCNVSHRTSEEGKSPEVLSHSDDNTKPLSCLMCKKHFKTRSYLERHIVIHSDVRSYSCEVCSACFVCMKYLQRHMRTHTGELRSTCDICQKSFSSKRNMEVHKQIHSGVKLYSCDICQKSFFYMTTLRKHMRTHFDEKPYSCDKCQKSFSYMTSLRVHMRTHVDEKPYSCEICQKSFSFEEKLLKHRVTHSDEKTFSCDICQKSFSEKCNLTVHMQIHSGVKPYTCDICQKSFLRKSYVKRHLQLHSSEKLYSCGTCQKSFLNKERLKRHSLTHIGVKPYSCHSCGRSFANKGNLRRHIHTHTKKKKFH